MTAPAHPTGPAGTGAEMDVIAEPPDVPALEREDIQSLILYGHGHLPNTSFIFLSAGPDRVRTRAWLAAVAERVSVAARTSSDKPSEAIHFAVTDGGLKALGVSDAIRDTFLQEFREGMGDADRARALGDVAGSAPEHWHCGGPKKPAIHFVLVLYAAGAPALAALEAVEVGRILEAGLSVVYRQTAALREGLVEPFGFRDGIGQPIIAGTEPDDARDGKPRGSAEPPVPAGEFLFGYPNAYGELPFGPRVPGKQTSDQLPFVPGEPGEPKSLDLGKNGTYLVIRKLEQDVAGFNRFLDENRDHAPGDVPAEQKEWLAARLVGRWRNGAPLDGKERPPQLASGEEPRNDFDFSEDPEGRICPVGAHIRRMNPRARMPNTDEGEGQSAESLKLAMRHRLIRRGRPYGEPRGTPEGIMFVAINTNIARQFELVQQTWLNNPRFSGLQNCRDPMAGANIENGGESHPQACTMAISVQHRALRLRLTGIPRFVHTRGGGYFFLPGRRALQYLASAAF